ncbi:MAG: efflux RND transporter permease subunit, partial [Gammaproteobacteria bacterium]
MKRAINRLFEAIVLDRPWLVFMVVACTLAVAVWFGQRFRLDVSAESLVLENDADLEYYREITKRYGSDDYLIVTYTPAGDLFAPSSLATLRALRDELDSLERVSSVVSLLDVPLLQSPPVTIAHLGEELRTLESATVDREAARRELLTSPLYRSRLMSPDGTTTAIQVNFARDETYWALLNERNRLRELARTGSADAAEVTAASTAFESYNVSVIARQEEDIARVREILGRYRSDARVYLGGIPMITTDMMQFIRHDIAVFGISVLAILGVALAWVFRGVRWVFIAFGIALSSSVFSVGIIGLLGWPVTVVSSNFLSLVLIFSVSLAVHLIVRYQELCELNPSAAQRELVAQTMRSKATPCLYTVLTTMVAFASLVLSDIRPVIDFGWMMVIALASAFVFAFTLFPAALVLLDKPAPRKSERLTGAITGTFARIADRFPLGVLVAGAL